MGETKKFGIGDVPTTTLELLATMREANLADDGTSKDSFWRPRPRRPQGQQLTAGTEWGVLTALLSFQGPPKDGKFITWPSVDSIAEVCGKGESTVRLYLHDLQERAVIRIEPRGKGHQYVFNHKKLAAAAKKAFAAKKAKRDAERDAKIKDEQAEQARLDAVWDEGVEDIPVFDRDRDPVQDAKDDATLSEIAAGEPEVEDDWRNDPKCIETNTEHLRSIYRLLGRDVPQDADLMPVLERLSQAPEFSSGHWDRVMDYAIGDKFWYKRLKESAPKYKGCPIAFFIANFAKIKAQADEKAPESGKDVHAKAAPKTSWNAAEWQQRYDEAQADEDQAMEDQDSVAWNRAQRRIEQLEEERNLALQS